MKIDINSNLWEQANCVNEDTEVFFPEEPSTRTANTLKAKALCGSCPIQAQCLEYAMENEDHGIWGGMTAAERIAFARLRRQSTKVVSTEQLERLKEAASRANSARSEQAANRVALELEAAIQTVEHLLSDDTKELVNLRIQYPSISLKEIGSMVNPPVSKSVVAGKLSRTLALAKKPK